MTTAHDDLVLRGQIVDRLLESADIPVILVTAPAGYGKTTVVRQWSEEDPRPFAWLSLDDDDNDPVTLVTYMMLALQRLGPVDAGILTAFVSDQPTATSDLLARLGRMVSQRQQPFVLVLDTIDALTSHDAVAVVQVIAEHMPPGSQLALIARRPPSLRWGEMRAKRQLLEIDTRALRLTPAEAEALLDAGDVHLSQRDLTSVLDATEGWAAGLYLAGLSLSEAQNTKGAVETVTGSGLIGDYLSDELLSKLAPEDREFLRQTSIISRMFGSLCDAVLATTGSNGRLRRLADSNTFLLPVDGADGWYRLHQMFADLLHAELLREEPELVQLLHSRASRWLEGHGEVFEAIEHAIAAAEVARAARLIWSQVPRCLASGDVARLERWLEAFSSRQVVGHAKLALTAAWCALQRGRPVDHWLSAADRGVYEASSAGESESVASATALLRATVAQHGLVQMGADAHLAARLQSPDDPWRCLATYLQGVSSHLTGHTSDADERLDEAEQLAETFGMPAWRALVMSQQALVAVTEHSWPRAQVLTDRTAALLRGNRLDDSTTLLMAYCVSALVNAKRGRADEARSLAQRCQRVVAVAARLAPWIVAQSGYVLARTHLILGDPGAARILLSEAHATLTDLPDAKTLRELLDQTWRQAEKAPLAFDGGVSTLTTAELRVLQLLPTYLSFEQIGRRLSVSRNTIKTQANAAYRKLGVTSRSEAVEHAYDLGLVSK
jgi:LuxR family maltose regulon positive regulatory protein